MKKKQIITTVFTTAVAAATVLTVVAGSITVQAKGEDCSKDSSTAVSTVLICLGSL